ncbi:MAG: polyprenyl diphosphate synthase [Polyangiaceae bacterium]|jgi:undecaprenyl diphosphate synthase|nr:polyprenyl diphosphate synthase [Polyangiaceae bacterium]
MAASSIPRHVAIIMDGNGRWAVQRGLPRHAGHREGANAVREVVRGCRKAGVEFLTVYAFSLANWKRPPVEVDALMRLLIHFAHKEVRELCEQEISVGVVGRPEDLPPATQRALQELIARTAGGSRMRLSLALSYSGRADLVAACRKIAEQVAAGSLCVDDVDETHLRGGLSTASLPDPDLVIRTGGEFRLSDFLPFESVYAELHFPNILWPDFREEHLLEAFAAYAHRERRFGRTSAQVEAAGSSR